MKHRLDETREFGDVEANRQLRRRIVAWVGWPLSILAAIAIGATLYDSAPSPNSSQPVPMVTTTLGPSGVATAPPAAPKASPRPVPATAGVAEPHPTSSFGTRNEGASNRTSTTHVVAPKPTSNKTPPSVIASPAPSAPEASPNAQRPLCLYLLVKLCL